MAHSNSEWSSGYHNGYVDAANADPVDGQYQKGTTAHDGYVAGRRAWLAEQLLAMADADAHQQAVTRCLRDAIDQSIREDRVIDVEFAGDEGALAAELHAIIDEDDDCTVVDEGDGVLDAWGTRGGADWRLMVTLT